jgi:ABC-type sugar transport system substrate-binding protein
VDRKIGLFIVSDQDYYHQLLASEASQAALEHGVELEVFSADDTPAKQASDVLRFVAANQDHETYVLVIPLADAPDGVSVEEDAFYRLASRVLAKGANWVTLNHGSEDMIAALRRSFPDRTVSLVMIDNLEFGRAQARQLKAIIPEGGRVLYVLGNPNDTASRERHQGLLEELAGRDYTIEEIDGWWRPDVAERNVMRWITSPMRTGVDVAAVLSQDDEMALAARRAMARAATAFGRPELASLPTLGGDGLPERGERWVASGELDGTVRVTLPGAPAVALLAEQWRTGVPMSPVTVTEPEAYPPPERLRGAQPRPRIRATVPPTKHPIVATA